MRASIQGESMKSRAQIPLSIEYIAVTALALDSRNPRLHSERQIKQIARSIQSFGYNVPVLVDRANKVLAGHGRVLAAKSLGLPELPAVRLESLSDAQARAFAIADNRLTENATWDDRLLGEILVELAAVELDFSLEDTGFSMAEIDLRIEGLSTPVPNAADPADQCPDLSDAPALSAPADVWVLGRHRLLCGNALEEAAYLTLMQGALAAMVFSDPPYNVKIDGHATGNGRIRHREFAMASGEMSAGQFKHFLASSFHLLAQHSVQGSLHFMCMDWRHMEQILAAGSEVYTELKNLCVWVKTNAGMGSLYRSQHELIFVFKNGKKPHRNNIELGRYGRNRTNVWNYPGANTLGRPGDEGNQLAMHPTVKPIALVADAILDCSVRGDIVLDTFLGSGSTLLAAERTGRVCYGMELDPLYVDLAIRRWQRYTGGTAVHATSKKRFDELARKKGRAR
jgi:DNA modification methylase